ncbi:MAG TPA: arylesterase [Gemmatimonadales bacterium]|nr:arylesterase [Gemmatimonadales bacterium]
MIARYFLPISALLLAACGSGAAGAAADRAADERVTEHDTSPPPDTSASRPTVLFVGTSLTAGLGLDPSQAYPAIIQEKIDSAGLDYRVVNAGVSGETSAGARRRVEWLFRNPPAVLVIETGANDGLRGLTPDSLAANIQAIIDRARALDPAPRMVLIGMEALPNMGAAYVRRFRAVYPALARKNGIPLVPFLLAGVAGVDSLNQADGLHPTAAGQRRVAATVWKVLEPVLRERQRAAA